VHLLVLWVGLQDWVMGPDRTGLIGLNKEGIVSLPGKALCWMISSASSLILD
jgi:hypothetical protein